MAFGLQGGIMEKDFCFGLIAGMLGGAILAANSFKVRKTVKDGQEQIMNALDKWNNEKNEENKGGEKQETEQQG